MSINNVENINNDLNNQDNLENQNLNIKVSSLLESIIFTSGTDIEIDEIQAKLPEYDSPTIMNAVRQLERKYSGDSGILLIHFENKLQLSSNPIYADRVSAVLMRGRERELSESLLETLAIIAYNQPITRSRIHNIRGKNPDYSIAKLAELHLIDVVARSENNAVLFGTTEEFLKRFQLRSIYDLPKRSDLVVRLKVLEENFQLNGRDLFIDKTQNGDTVGESMDSIINDTLSRAGIENK